MQTHSQRKIYRFCSLEIQRSPLLLHKKPQKKPNLNSYHKLAYKSIEVVKDISERRNHRKYKVKFHKKSFTERDMSSQADLKQEQRYKAMESVREYNNKQNEEKNQQLNMKKMLKVKLNKRRQLFHVDSSSTLVKKQNRSIEEQNFDNYLTFIKNKKRDNKIAIIKHNRRGEMKRNLNVIKKTVDESKIQKIDANAREKTKRRTLDVDHEKQSRKQNIDVEMSSIMEVNQSSFLSDCGKNILGEVKMDSLNLLSNQKSLKKEKSTKKGNIMKSFQKLKHVFPKGFFCT